MTSCYHSSEEVIYEHQETSNSSRRQRKILREVACMITYDVQVDGENHFIAQPLWRALHSAGNVLKFSRPTYQKMLRITRSTMKHQRNCSMLPEMLCLLSRFTCACCDLLTVLNQTTTSDFTKQGRTRLQNPINPQGGFPPAILHVGFYQSGGFLLSAATMAIPTHFLVLRPLNHFSSASRCDGGS